MAKITFLFLFFVFFIALCSCGCIQQETPDRTLLEGTYPGASGDSWCDTDYAKRIDVNINNTAGSALTDYQVYVDLSANPINETSLRVYNTTSCTLRSHWCENITDGNCTELWIKHSTISASTWTNNTALYHDNPTANSASVGGDTFLFFDDFETYNTGDLNGQGSWSGHTNYDVSTEDVYHGTQAVKCITSANALNMAKVISISGNYILHLAGKTTADGIRYQTSLNGGGLNFNTVYIDEGNNINAWNGVAYIDSGTNWVSGAWHYIDLYCKPSNKQDMYYDNVKIISDGTRATATMTSYELYVKLGSGTVYYDELYVRGYATPEPSTSLGSEENQPDQPPAVALNSPSDNTLYVSQSITFNCSVSDTVNLTNVSLYGNWSGGWHNNETNTTGVNGHYTFSKTISDGNYKWNCRACDNISNCVFGDNNWTFMIDSVKPSVSWAPPTPIDGSSQSENHVYLNATFADSSDVSAVFDWDYSLLRWFSFEDHNTSYVFDNSSYSVDSKIEGDTAANIIESTSKFGKCVNLTDGTYIDLGQIQNFTDNFTIEAWFKNNDKGKNDIIVSSWNLSSNFSDSSNWQVAAQPVINGKSMNWKAGAVYDGRYIYYMGNTKTNGNYPRFDTRCGDLSNDSCFEVFDIAEVDAKIIQGFSPSYDGRYVYYGSFDSNVSRKFRVYRYNTSESYTNSASWDTYDVSAGVDVGLEQMVGSAIDNNGIMYFSEYETTSDAAGRHIVAYDTAKTFNSASSWRVMDTNDAFSIAPKHRGILYLNNYIYVVSKNYGYVFRYDTTKGLDGFNSSANWAYYNAHNEDGADVWDFEGIMTDGRYIYPTPYSDADGLVRYDTTKSFSDSASWVGITPSYGGGYDYAGGVFDGRYIYYIQTVHDSDIMVRFDTTKAWTSTSFETFTLDTDGGYYAGGFDGRHVYYTPQACSPSFLPSHDFTKFDTAQAGTFQILSNWQNSNGGVSGMMLGTSAIINTENISYSLHARNKPDNEWHHVALIVDNKNAKLYFDKELKDNVTIPGPFNTVTENIDIGKIYADATNTTKSVISELRIHNRVLTSIEINASYNVKAMNYLNRNFTDLSAGTYNYSAYIIDNAGNLNISSGRTVYITGEGTTPAISNVQNGSVSSTSQYVNATINQTAHNRVLYSNESDLTPAYYSSWDNSTALPNITLSGLTASTQYWYQAWSYNTTNNLLSDNSSTLSFTTAAVDTSFTVTLPSGYTYLRFEPTNATATNVTPNGQTDLQEFYNVTNTGDVNLDVRLQLNETVANIILKADSDSNSVGAKEVNTTLVTIHSNLAIANTADIWLWSDFNYAVQQDTNKTISINVTQSP